MSVRTILLTLSAWLEFCRLFPTAAQWLILQLDLPVYSLRSLTPSGEDAALLIPGETDDRPYPG